MISRPAVWLATLLLTAPAILRAERLPIKTYTTAEGLVHNDVHRIVRDSRGFLWFCTAGGLSQFDGYTFRNFGTEHGLPHSSVNDLLETRGGEYWLATDGGLVRFDPKGRPDRHVSQDAGSTTERPMFAVVMPGDAAARAPAVTVLLEGHDGTVWAGTRQGLFRLELSAGRRSLRAVDIRTPTEYPGQREIADLLEDAQGSLWMASPSGLYRRWRDGSTARYTTRDGLPRDDVWDLFQDRSGRLWAATHMGGFFRLRPGPDRETPVVDSQFGYRDGDEYGLPSPWVFQLFEASDGRFWVATARGLAEFLDRGDEHPRFRSYTKRNGLSYFDITAVNEDLGGNLWLGTNSAGVMKLTRGGFSTYGEQDGIETVNHVFEDRAGHLAFRGNVLGDVRTSVFEGARLDVLRGDRPVFHPRLGQLKDERFTWFTPATVTNLGWVMEHVTLQARDGTWWVGTADGPVPVSGTPGDHGGGHGTPPCRVHHEGRSDCATGVPVVRGLPRPYLDFHHSSISERPRPLGSAQRDDSRPDARRRASRVPRRPPAFVRGRAVWHTVVWLQQWPRALRARHVHLFHAGRGIAARRDYGHPR